MARKGLEAMLTGPGPVEEAEPPKTLANTFSWLIGIPRAGGRFRPVLTGPGPVEEAEPPKTLANTFSLSTGIPRAGGRFRPVGSSGCWTGCGEKIVWSK